MGLHETPLLTTQGKPTYAAAKMLNVKWHYKGLNRLVQSLDRVRTNVISDEEGL